MNYLKEENEFDYLDTDVSDYLRMAINDENEAILNYNGIINKCSEKLVIDVLKDIVKEEKIHVHELINLLHMYDEYEEIAMKKADKEIDEILT